MRMNITIEFDAPLLKTIPSIGGFEFLTETGEQVAFDYLESCGGPELCNPKIVHWELRDEDTITFPKMANMITYLSNISEITECYLDYEEFEPGEPIPNPVRIIDWSMEIFTKIPIKEIRTDLILIIKTTSDKNGSLYQCIFPQKLLETFHFNYKELNQYGR